MTSRVCVARTRMMWIKFLQRLQLNKRLTTQRSLLSSTFYTAACSIIKASHHNRLHDCSKLHVFDWPITERQFSCPTYNNCSLSLAVIRTLLSVESNLSLSPGGRGRRVRTQVLKPKVSRTLPSILMRLYRPQTSLESPIIGLYHNSYAQIIVINMHITSICVFFFLGGGEDWEESGPPPLPLYPTPMAVILRLDRD